MYNNIILKEKIIAKTINYVIVFDNIPDNDARLNGYQIIRQ